MMVVLHSTVSYFSSAAGGWQLVSDALCDTRPYKQSSRPDGQGYYFCVLFVLEVLACDWLFITLRWTYFSSIVLLSVIYHLQLLYLQNVSHMLYCMYLCDPILLSTWQSLSHEVPV